MLGGRQARVKVLADLVSRAVSLFSRYDKAITIRSAFALRPSRWLWYVAAEPKQGRNPP